MALPLFIGVQFLAFGLVVVVAPKVGAFSFLQIACFQGVLASLLCFLTRKRFSVGSWWIGIHLLFFPSLALGMDYSAPIWVYPTAFALILLLNWNSFKERVPLYLTSTKGYIAVEELLKEKNTPFLFTDLGCGLAGMLMYLAKRFPEGQFEGYETAPLSFFLAWLRSLSRSNLKIRYKNLWKVELSKMDFAYCFLSPVPMPAIWKKVNSEMKRPESLLISNTFAVPDITPFRTLSLGDWRDGKLYLYRT